MTTNGTFFQVDCLEGPPQQFRYSCPTGDNIAITCDGSFKGMAQRKCPIYQTSPTCTLQVDQLPKGVEMSCDLLLADEDSIQCQCTFTRQHRRLGEDDDDEASDPSVLFSLRSIQKSVADDFVTTWSETPSLTTGDIQDSWTVLLTVGLIGFLFVCLVLLAMAKDEREKVEMEAQISKTTAKDSIESQSSKRVPSAVKKGRNKLSRQISQETLLVRTEFNRIEESLPAVFRADSVWNKFVNVSSLAWDFIFLFSRVPSSDARLVSLLEYHCDVIRPIIDLQHCGS